MPRKNAKTKTEQVTEDILDELFTSHDDNTGFAFPVPVCVALGRIFVATAHLGGMVTLYRGGPNNRHIVSVRFGDRKRAIEVDDSEGSVELLEQLANGVEHAWAKVFLARKEAKKVTDEGESGK